MRLTYKGLISFSWTEDLLCKLVCDIGHMRSAFDCADGVDKADLHHEDT